MGFPGFGDNQEKTDNTHYSSGRDASWFRPDQWIPPYFGFSYQYNAQATRDEKDNRVASQIHENADQQKRVMGIYKGTWPAGLANNQPLPVANLSLYNPVNAVQKAQEKWSSDSVSASLTGSEDEKKNKAEILQNWHTERQGRLQTYWGSIESKLNSQRNIMQDWGPKQRRIFGAEALETHVLREARGSLKVMHQEDEKALETLCKGDTAMFEELKDNVLAHQQDEEMQTFESAAFNAHTTFQAQNEGDLIWANICSMQSEEDLKSAFAKRNQRCNAIIAPYDAKMAGAAMTISFKDEPPEVQRARQELNELPQVKDFGDSLRFKLANPDKKNNFTSGTAKDYITIKREKNGHLHLEMDNKFGLLHERRDVSEAAYHLFSVLWIEQADRLPHERNLDIDCGSPASAEIAYLAAARRGFLLSNIDIKVNGKPFEITPELKERAEKAHISQRAIEPDSVKEIVNRIKQACTFDANLTQLKNISPEEFEVQKQASLAGLEKFKNALMTIQNVEPATDLNEKKEFYNALQTVCSSPYIKNKDWPGFPKQAKPFQPVELDAKGVKELKEQVKGILTNEFQKGQNAVEKEIQTPSKGSARWSAIDLVGSTVSAALSAGRAFSS